jgi:hypothetical protein
MTNLKIRSFQSWSDLISFQEVVKDTRWKVERDEKWRWVGAGIGWRTEKEHVIEHRCWLNKKYVRRASHWRMLPVCSRPAASICLEQENKISFLFFFLARKTSLDHHVRQLLLGNLSKRVCDPAARETCTVGLSDDSAKVWLRRWHTGARHVRKCKAEHRPYHVHDGKAK